MEGIPTIVEALVLELRRRGIPLLKHVRVSGTEVMVTCPSHKDGQENHPSCTISTIDKVRTKAGTVHCFNCGYNVDFQTFVSNCLGFNDRGKRGTQWLLENFLAVTPEQRTLPTLERRQKEVDITYVTDEELDTYRYYHPYMYERKLTDEIIEKFDVGYDKERQCLTFPVWDNKGRCVFIARRSVNTKYFNYPEGAKKPLYGEHFITNDIKVIIVCESIINCLTCWAYGKPAVALIGLGNKQQTDSLKTLNVRKVILALDPDRGGRIATQKLRKILKNSGKLVSELVVPEGKDINNLSEAEFKGLKELY